jgi:hypothetical protein
MAFIAWASSGVMKNSSQDLWVVSTRCSNKVRPEAGEKDFFAVRAKKIKTNLFALKIAASFDVPPNKNYGRFITAAFLGTKKTRGKLQIVAPLAQDLTSFEMTDPIHRCHSERQTVRKHFRSPSTELRANG